MTNYVLRNKKTDKLLCKRGEPVTLVRPTPEHVQKTIDVLNKLTGGDFEAVVRRMQQV